MHNIEERRQVHIDPKLQLYVLDSKSLITLLTEGTIALYIYLHIVMG